MLRLKRVDVDFERCTTWVHADEAKGREAIGVPLNEEAMAVLSEEKGKQPECVFTYKGRPLAQLNTTSWRNAPKRAGIEDFRLRRPRTFVIAVECRATQGLAKRRCYVFVYSCILRSARRGPSLSHDRFTP